MKYLLAAILLTLSIPASADRTEDSIRHKVICQEGYKFLVTWADAGTVRPPSVVQIYKRGDGALRPPQPMKCEE